MSKTLSISRDVNDPAKREVTFEQVKEAYREQVEALLDGGVDVLLVETIFDTLNAKAALFAITQVFEERGVEIPILISGTITDLSGRTLTGQTVEAFWTSVSHAPLLSVGLNCALGPQEMRPYIEELSRIAPVFVSAYPNAGLPDPLSATGFPETPESLAPQIREWAEQGWLNIVGGCCGTTPPHIQAIAAAVRDCPARPLLIGDPIVDATQESGAPRVAAPLSQRSRASAHHAGYRVRHDRRAHEYYRLAEVLELILAGDFEGALAVARQQVDGGANILDVNMDEGMIDSEAAMTRFLNLISSEPDICRIPIMIDSSKWERHRGRAPVRAREERRQFHQPQGRRGGFHPQGPAGPSLRRGGDRHGLR